MSNKQWLLDETGEYIYAVNGDSIAKVATVWGASNIQMKNRAQLIVAAPELLEALKAMLPAYRKAVGLYDANTDDNLTVDAHNAIAKAEGSRNA